MIRIAPESSDKPLKMPWRTGITVGRAYDLMRADLQEQLRQSQRELGWRYIRFHGLFHDDMDVVRRDPVSGRLRFQWHHLDKLIDFLLSIGLKPFAELNPMPAALASGTQTMFHYQMNVTPPADWTEWEALIEAFARHGVERYGLAEVRTWYFEVWNEPNLKGFWSGSQEDYWLLYRHAANALKRVDSGLRVGGPATASVGWIEDFLHYCEHEEVPVDFVSTHCYPQDEYCQYPDREGSPFAPGTFFREQVRRVHDLVRNSFRPDLEIHWTEWNTQSAIPGEPVTWSANRFVDSCFAASFIVRNCLELDEACDSLSYWVLSDIFEEGKLPSAPFSSTYGLRTIHGLPKASYNAFLLLREMQGHTVAWENDNPLPPGAGLRAVRTGDRWKALLWHHPALEDHERAAWRDTLTFPLPANARTRIFTTRIAPGQGSAWESWRALGSPHHLGRTEWAWLTQQAAPHRTWHDPSSASSGDVVTFDFTLAPYTVLLVEAFVIDPPAVGTGADGEADQRFDQLLHTGPARVNDDGRGHGSPKPDSAERSPAP